MARPAVAPVPPTRCDSAAGATATIEQRPLCLQGPTMVATAAGAGPLGTVGRMAADDDVLVVDRALTIPLSELRWRFSRSGGPGGQHANTADTRVEVIFDVVASPTLRPHQRARLLERLGPEVVAVAADERSQLRNRGLALARLAGRLRVGLHVEPPRVATRPTRGSQRRRVDAKRRRSETKRLRRPPDAD